MTTTTDSPVFAGESFVRIVGSVTTRYLSRKEVAERIGVAPDTLSRYRLPEPDAVIGTVRGWSVETIDGWNASRPGRGRSVSG